MIKNIVRDVMFLSKKSVEADKNDMNTVKDLQDTLKANHDRCAGMAANMIGVSKRIIIVNLGMFDMVMINPVMLSKSGEYQTSEGCLSLDGERPAVRYENIEVKYLDAGWNERTQKFSGFIAQVIQHEMDHLDGIII